MMTTLPMTTGTTLPTRRDGLSAVTRLADRAEKLDANYLANQRNVRIRMIMQAIILVMGAVIGHFTMDRGGAILGLLAAILPASFLLIVLTESYERTLHVGDMDETRIEAMLAMLIHASQNGLGADDRMALQQAIYDASDVATAMTGMTPRAVLERTTSVVVPSRLRDRGIRLAELAPGLAGTLGCKGGASRYTFKEKLAPTVQIIDAMARDFGLAPAGFGAEPLDARMDPGAAAQAMIDMDPDSPATPVRRLGLEWRQGPRPSEATAAHLAADSAATTDLDAIETAWRTAREHAVPTDVERIDAEFAAGCRVLSARLSSAIIERSAALRDGVSDTRRYLEAKHRDADGGRVDHLG